MFKKIDAILIRKTQWTVRQIELFTPITRKTLRHFLEIITTIFAAFTIFLVLIILTFFIFVEQRYFFMGCMILALFLGAAICQCSTALYSIKKNKKENYQTENTQEIVSREAIRKLAMIIMMTSALIVSILAVTAKNEKEVYLGYIFFPFGEPCLSTLFALLLEYFLCTVPTRTQTQNTQKRGNFQQ